jgi:hypothetical protein
LFCLDKSSSSSSFDNEGAELFAATNFSHTFSGNFPILSALLISIYTKKYITNCTTTVLHNVHTAPDHENYRTLSATWVRTTQTLAVVLYQELIHILERCLG